MPREKLIALFPEASFGAALNCIGIAQALREQGARPVFICHEHFQGLFAEYGFAEYPLLLDSPLSAEEHQHYWERFIERNIPYFDQTPLEQIDSYVAPAWEAIIDTAIEAEKPLQQLLARLKPDAIVLDNVVMFPAIAKAGCPWVRVISCAETELPDPAVPPYLSGASASDKEACQTYWQRYVEAVEPAHSRFSRFLESSGHPPCAPGLFLEESPWLNLLLSPTPVRYERQQPLDPQRFVYLDGCVRREAPYVVPPFPQHNDAPLIYLSFGSLGAADVGMMKRLIAIAATLPYRFLVNVGAYREQYDAVPDNVYLDSWYPQPAVLRECQLFIHHGGNNSFCEALYFGLPSLIIPYCWDGHDNARRAEEVGVGRYLPRFADPLSALPEAIAELLTDNTMQQRLADARSAMQASHGTEVAARAILGLSSS
ncbi:glycosyltransferase [Pseudomonas berkeleyensis]|uniref:Glycosyltransferase n=1 Tax=Pseudomonas berkeleyensis TaxID=2726956 RepID=A0A7G5DK63_9PSED|nr:glycosyltransferase [Pseudomonas berkeleyensis]QMV62138.1 glycosyltransferase [Pseudomonas berkeleyensis]WSO37579.1 glycosyltransferase [Pseudomonas berkeleyensis]